MSQAQPQQRSNRTSLDTALIKEQSCLVQPRLEQILGCNEARIVQQIFYWSLRPGNDDIMGRMERRHYFGRLYVNIPPAFFSNPFRGAFRAWGESTIGRAINGARNAGVLRTENLGGLYNTNWYSVYEDHITLLSTLYSDFAAQVEAEFFALKNDQHSRRTTLSAARQNDIWLNCKRHLDEAKKQCYDRVLREIEAEKKLGESAAFDVTAYEPDVTGPEIEDFFKFYHFDGTEDSTPEENPSEEDGNLQNEGGKPQNEGEVTPESSSGNINLTEPVDSESQNSTVNLTELLSLLFLRPQPESYKDQTLPEVEAPSNDSNSTDSEGNNEVVSLNSLVVVSGPETAPPSRANLSEEKAGAEARGQQASAQADEPEGPDYAQEAKERAILLDLILFADEKTARALISHYGAETMLNALDADKVSDFIAQLPAEAIEAPTASHIELHDAERAVLLSRRMAELKIEPESKRKKLLEKYGTYLVERELDFLPYRPASDPASVFVGALKATENGPGYTPPKNLPQELKERYGVDMPAGAQNAQEGGAAASPGASNGPSQLERTLASLPEETRQLLNIEAKSRLEALGARGLAGGLTVEVMLRAVLHELIAGALTTEKLRQRAEEGERKAG